MASIVWPSASYSALVLWRSEVPVGAVILSQLSSTGDHKTITYIPPASQAHGTGSEYQGNDYGGLAMSLEQAPSTFYAPQMALLCSRRQQETPTCEALGYRYEISWSEPFVSPSNGTAWPGYGGASAHLLWPAFPTLDGCLWRSDVPVQAIIYTEYDPMHPDAPRTTAEHLQGEAMHGAGIDVNGTAYGAVNMTAGNQTQFLLRSISLCANPPANQPNVTCAALGYAYAVAFSAAEGGQVRSWDAAGAFGAQVVWPAFPSTPSPYSGAATRRWAPSLRRGRPQRGKT